MSFSELTQCSQSLHDLWSTSGSTPDGSGRRFAALRTAKRYLTKPSAPALVFGNRVARSEVAVVVEELVVVEGVLVVVVEPPGQVEVPVGAGDDEPVHPATATTTAAAALTTTARRTFGIHGPQGDGLFRPV
ncbi:MAG: hypothetical protein U0Q14_06175 [Dermatophilaceae bacterium]